MSPASSGNQASRIVHAWSRAAAASAPSDGQGPRSPAEAGESASFAARVFTGSGLGMAPKLGMTPHKVNPARNVDTARDVDQSTLGASRHRDQHSKLPHPEGD